MGVGGRAEGREERKCGRAGYRTDGKKGNRASGLAGGSTGGLACGWADQP